MGRRPILTTRALAAMLAAGGLGLCALVVTRAPVEAHKRIKTTLTWKKDIAPIVQRRCAFCHSAGNLAPSFATFADARPWAAAMREEVLTRHMPPWSAVAGYGRFRGDPSLTQGEWDLLVAWVDGDGPSGQTLREEQEPVGLAPGDPTWTHGPPDVLLKVPATAAVPAGSPDLVRRFDVVVPLKSARRIHGLAFKPGDRRVVRYASVVDVSSNRWLFTWTPWLHDLHLPEGVAFTLPAGAKLRVEIGYRGTREDVTDASELGLYVDEARSGPVATVQTLHAAAPTSPGHDGAMRIRAETVLKATAAVQAMWPEVPEGTTSLEVTAVMPDGAVRPLLWLRDPRVEWPAPYVAIDPVPLPAGTRVTMTAHIAPDNGSAGSVRPGVSLVLVPSAVTTF